MIPDLKARMFFRFPVLTAVVLIISAGCAKTPIEKSYWADQKPAGSTFSGYNSDDNLQWTVTNDSTRLYLFLATSNRNLERTIFMRGLTIYVDSSAKKHKDKYLKYPYRSMNNSPFAMNGEGHGRFRKDRDDSSAMKKRHAFSSPETAYWKNGNDEEILNPALKHTGFSYHIQVDSQGFMDYQVAIPLDKIAAGGYPSIKKLSVGIVLSDSPFQHRRSFQGRGGFGGGGYGGHGGFGGRGGGRRPPVGGGERGRFQPAKVDQWFITNLAGPDNRQE